MNSNFIFLFSFFLCLGISFSIKAQTTDLGNPKSWSIKGTIPAIDYHLMPVFDLGKQKKIDLINDATGMKPWQFGYEHQLNLGLTNAGTWIVLPNGDRIWQIEFESKDALTMNVVFDEFVLPEGASMSIYNPLTREFEGAYTNKNNNPDRMLGTSLLQGENLIVEYYEPKERQGQGILNISMVVHGYRPLGNHPLAKAIKDLNDSGACNHDVLCPLGIGWEDQINSVAMIIVGGSGSCTGALINNTTNDGTPYFLSANHCGTTGLGSWVFRFNWDSPVAVCAQNGNSQDPGAPYNQVNGATLRANNAGSDFCLMELNSTPTGNVYYAGWDRSTTPATEATGIHHPRGDVKKICRENNTLVPSTMSGAQVWEVTDWDLGVTEPASSGSPLFNQNQLIIGQLYGGTAACTGTNDNGQDDNYGRLDVSWNGSSAATRLNDWLDPAGSGVLTHSGYNPNGPGQPLDAGITQIVGIEPNYCNIDSFTPEVTLRNFGVDTVVTVDILYNLDGAANSTYTWNGSLLSNTVTTVVLPTLTATAGAHTFNVSTTMPNGAVDSNTVNDTRSTSFFITMGGEQVRYNIATDCFGSETSWSITDTTTGLVLFSGGPYSDGTTRDTISDNLCLAAGCYKFVIYDSFGDGLDGSGVWWCNRSGNYWVDDAMGNNLVQMPASTVNGDFGDSAVHYFCLPFVATNQDKIVKTVEQFQVYPNPTNGQIQVSLALNNQNTVLLEVYNATGQLLQQQEKKQFQQGQFQVDLGNYAAGMYFVKLRVGDKVYAEKVLKH